LNIHEETLAGVWTEVLAERRDAELSRRRKLEAICGYDPDEAPDELLRMLVENGATLGFAALEEVAAAGRHLSAEVLQEILNLTKSGASSTQGGFRGVLPTINATPADAEDELPWQIGEKLARLARSQWCFDDKPITDSDLADLLQVPAKVFEDGEKCPISIPVALRTEEADTFDIYFDSPRNANRRFAIARLLGDHLRMNDRLLPATKAKTARQKIQRTFAQEFLCPIDALLAKIQTDQPDDLDLDEAAAYFKVSPLLVRATLVNKGYLDRESLNVPA
jgi:Zn-dependent peptidase ImmA (M78 family)